MLHQLPFVDKSPIDEPGYTRVNAYLVNDEESLHQYAQQHVCPCCQHRLSFMKSNQLAIVKDNQGRLVISILDKCYCGFMVPFHAILNILDDQSYDAHILISQHEVVTDAENDRVEAALLESRYLLHKRLYHSAIYRIDQLINSLQSIALLAFYRGYAFDQLELYESALKSYDDCLDLDAECKEAWHNKALILKKLKRIKEANFHLVKYCKLCPVKTLNEIDGEMHDEKQLCKPLYAKKGKFGKITIVQTSCMRYLAINNEVEGSFWLTDEEASDVPAGDYVAGLLLAGCHFNAQFQQTKGLILGLGAGAGVIALLANFPKLHLDVVEIDFDVIMLACCYFPLLNEYIKSGRLSLICDDGLDYVTKTQQHYDFVLLDIYQGDHQFAKKLREVKFLCRINELTRLVGVNLLPLDSIHSYERITEDFKSAGIQLKQCYPTGNRGDDNDNLKKMSYQNRILYSENIDNITGFIPYATRNGYLEHAFRRDFSNMVNRCEYF
ncbi:hypothetical protein [Spartinivicinus poritis]|uniref:Uncharacterized protein n=1 Tax=Spartinivicinus poritis TaxID=2994640 RepID=A0ABT5U713_9GAMM|nr:hypothetical protein [Spartinivicinus sp. A2-2]MDE1462161.1 hypothetical protein [Spartinivicinus sp. A2-2]